MRNLSSAEPLLGIANRADHSRFQVLPAAHKIEHFPAHRIEQHSIDGEIAARYIFLRVAAEPHFVRMPTIRIPDIAAESSDLNRMRSGTARRRHQHYTELHSHGISLRKYPHDLLRRRVRGHIVVFRFAPQQKIAHASTHQIGLKAPLAQGLHN